MNPEVFYFFSLLAMLAILFIAYSVKVIAQGRSRYERVDRQQGSILLGKALMEMTYWGLQPLGDFFIFLGFSPNAISYLSLIFGLAAGAALMDGSFGLAGFFSAFCAILDAVDGMVARKTGTSSDSGEVLDASVDRYVEFFFFSGLIIHYRHLNGALLLTLSALMGSFMVSYSTAKAEALQVTPPRGSMRRPERALYLTLGALMVPLSHGYSMIFALMLVSLMANGSALRRLHAIAQLVKK